MPSFYGHNYEGEEGGGTTDLTSLAARDETRVPQGVVVDEMTAGVDLNVSAVKKLKYPVPNMDEHDIEKYLSFAELELIAGDIDDVRYPQLLDEKNRGTTSLLRHGTKSWTVYQLPHNINWNKHNKHYVYSFYTYLYYWIGLFYCWMSKDTSFTSSCEQISF